jgi:diaminopimelate epimerase
MMEGMSTPTAPSPLAGAPFAKGHGAGNDFVILPDPDGTLPLTPPLVAALCDRRRGVGGDGLLRVVRSARHPDAARYAGDAEWFMDYWNGDGSSAEMCGNGIRVFGRYLVEYGLDLTRSPKVDGKVFPNGVNVEFVETIENNHVSIRVHERGVGETLACGSGACAVAAVVLAEAELDRGTVEIDLPGGRLTATIDGGGLRLAGPAVIVAEGTLRA